ncbi:GNAT family N-acetyltransferase [Janibacter hoylei PVAS-1]|uniref:GNAT family N-acetyltransferase n=1 Tax=Janibacter hoylei PVAS-1 TaxID=1210046 RepID=A0A444B7U7_9MICO|nr:GNAT family N-acetyltransferase [Janibacter hoylei]RWU84464.1 GNAT family N-acetyltransferase [Janibacter hoylei PVAS-1]
MMLGIRSLGAPVPPAPDVYFSSLYGTACQIETGGTWHTLTDDSGDWQLPFLVSSIPGQTELFDASSPYGYAGIAVNPDLPASDQQAMWESAKGILREAGVVSLFLRHSPLVHTMPAQHLGQHLTVVPDHPTVAVPISTPDEMWKSLEGRSRTAIRKAQKSGLTSLVRPATKEDLHPHGPFRRLYEATMHRVRAKKGYFFSDMYYVALLESLGSDLQLVEVQDSQGKPAAAALLLRHNQTLHYHLSGSEPLHARVGANNLLIWQAMLWSAQNGLRRLHLGGGVGTNDALLRFKKSFGGELLSFAATGHIIDPARYQRLVNQMRNTPLPTSTFFPAYRSG